MAISEDLRSVQAALGSMSNASLDAGLVMRLVCSNLLALADQVEALENMPLVTRELAVPIHGKGFRRGGHGIVPARVAS